MYLEEIDGIIYIDNLPSLSPNMEVSFIKKKFSIFSSSLQLSFAALKLYPTHPNFLGVGGIKLLNSASKIKKMLNEVQKFWRICVFFAGDNLFSFVPKWLRQINSLSTRWAEFQKSLRKCGKFMNILNWQ